jgi:hypothetical protein
MMMTKTKALVERKFLEMLQEATEDIVKALSEKYAFAYAEAVEYLASVGEAKSEAEKERGRPKKAPKTKKGNKVNADVSAAETEGDDLIASLVAEAAARRIHRAPPPTRAKKVK